MRNALTRRDLIQSAPALALTAGVLVGVPGAEAAQPNNAARTPWPGFPRQDASLVAQVVGLSHSNEARVRELVKAQPALVNAWWDWGFGDWESPLGAASHVGQRAIAEFLLEHGARMDIFAAAMLGMTDVVRAFVAAKPGVQRTLGPHGIPLLAHAQAGGKRAADTLAYLESLGDAGVRLKVAPLPEARREVFVGRFASDETGIRLETRMNKNGQLVVEIQSGNNPVSRPNLHHLGDDEFFPSGVPSVRFRFAVAGGRAQSVTIRMNEQSVTAKRVGG